MASFWIASSLGGRSYRLCVLPSSRDAPAARLLGPGPSLLLQAGLVGALLVLVADLVGQWAFESRYPVGVITGILGAPYLVYLLVRTHRSGGSL